MQPVLEIEWLEIPKGDFLWGLSDEVVAHWQQALASHRNSAVLKKMLQEERGARRLTLPTFYISRYPITIAQYASYLSSGYRYAQHDLTFSSGDVAQQFRQALAEQPDHPIDRRWDMAMAFCEWMGARLPTVWEWQKAARGTEGYLYPWGNKWDLTRGNFEKQAKWNFGTSPVTAYPKGQSPFGLLDVMGNCFEWTLSTSIGQMRYQEPVTVSSSFRFSHKSDVRWFDNRVTASYAGTMPSPISFRPLLEEWRTRYFPTSVVAQ